MGFNGENFGLAIEHRQGPGYLGRCQWYLPKTKLIWPASQLFKTAFRQKIQAWLRDIARDISTLVLDHHNKANITIKGVTWTFWFPSAYKSYVYNYTIVY